MFRLGMWLFFGSEAFLFAGILTTRFFLMPGIRPDLNQMVGLIVTSVLLLSSLTMYMAETSIHHGDQKGLERYTLLTILLGVGFLAGVVGIEWRSVPFGPADGVQGAVFFLMTGMHAFHVLTGVIFLGVVYFNARRGYYTADHHWGAESAALYWHFVDVVWVFFYPALYLIGVLAAK
jgi:cytochrome c oxidase subunit 3